MNHKRVCRIYREERLAVRQKQRKRIAARARVQLDELTRPNYRWSMDFLSDTLATGRPFRIFTLLDEFTRDCPAIEIDTSLPALRVIRVLERVAAERGFPHDILIDNGPEFTSKALDFWAWQRGSKLRFIRPGNPSDNAFIESSNGKFRDECLNTHWFLDLDDARSLVERRRHDYNHDRPHSSPDNLTPMEFANRAGLAL